MHAKAVGYIPNIDFMATFAVSVSVDVFSMAMSHGYESLTNEFGEATNWRTCSGEHVFQ
jgi:hypothetical protein